MTSRDLKRREFLKAMNLGLCALPLLGESAFAQQSKPTKRLLTIMQTGGAIESAFWPTGGPNLATASFPGSTKPLEPFANSLTFVKGLWQRNFLDNFPPFGPGYGDSCGPVGNKNLGCSHGGSHESYASLFTAKRARAVDGNEVRGFMQSHATGPSLDQFVGRKIAAAGGPGPLTLGVQMGAQQASPTQWECSYVAENQPVAPQDDTRKLFDQYFANRPTGPDPAMERMRLQRKSLLDSVGKDLERFSARAGREYQYKVQAHLTAVRDLERLLEAPPVSPTCQGPTLPAYNPGTISQYDKAIEAQLRFVVAAFACDVSRVICLQLTNAHSDHIVFNWLGLSGAGQEFPTRSFHDVQHRPGPNGADKIKVENWYFTQLAFLLKQMTEIREGAASLLDNSAVLWANHMGDGGAHSSDNLPWLVAGSCGGALATGKLLTVPNQTSHTGVLTSLATAMGYPADATFADPAYAATIPGMLA